MFGPVVLAVGNASHPPIALALALLLAVLGLAVGPALVALGRGHAVASAAVEGLTLGLVPALLALRLLPHVYGEIGPLALALFAAGFVALWLADRWQHRAGARLGQAVILPTLVAHAVTDGAGLALAVASSRGAGSSGALLGAALLLHRLPEGLFLASTLVPALGWRRTLPRLGLVALATVVGGAGGQALLSHVPEGWFDGVVALGLGAMLRLVLHSHAPAARAPKARAAAGAAFALGLIGALALPSPDSVLARAQPRELSLVQSLGPLFVETAPSLLLGLLAAGLLQAVAPRQRTAWLRGGGSLAQALRGLVFGLPQPVCAHRVQQPVRGLLLAGAPTAAVVAFAIGAPALGVDSAALSLRLLGWPLTLVRLCASGLVALVAALLVARATPKLRASASPQRSAGRLGLAPPRAKDASPAPESASAEAPFSARLRDSVVAALGPSLDHVAAWYLVGLVAAAALEASVDPALVARVHGPTDVLLSALLAIPVFLCAQGATPMAAVMIHKGFSVGAALAFLLVGSGTNLAVLVVVRRALGARAALAFGLGSLVPAVLVGLVANYLVSPASVPAIHPLVAHDHVRAEWVCAVTLAALLAASLLRLGPRAWFAELSLRVGDPSDAHGVQGRAAGR